MVLYPNKLPESERVCSGICTSCFVGSDSFVVTVSFGIPRQTPAFDESLRHHFVLEQSLRNILNRYRSIGQPQYPAVACIATLSRLGVIIPSQVFVSLSVLFDRNLFVMKYNPHFFCNFLQKKCRFHPVLWQGDTKRCFGKRIEFLCRSYETTVVLALLE